MTTPADAGLPSNHRDFDASTSKLPALAGRARVY
jgi:hypothetical protein